MLQAFETGKRVCFEDETSSGATFTAVVEPVRDESGHVPLVVVVVHDISEPKRAEEQRFRLANAIERAFILCGGGVIGLEHLPVELTARGDAATGRGGIRTAHDLLDAQAIRAALKRHGGNRAAVARDLGIHKTTLYRRLKKLQITLPARDGRSRGEVIS